ncbi:hypothetical protein C8R44DRAFT_879625 [Mycena epipterygia]|nr:hypothetical protein C8R44DRAFT_879625 [Mycena epipterygia]
MRNFTVGLIWAVSLCPCAHSVTAAGLPSYPTHALAIAPADKDVGGPHAILPMHTVVLATHCAALPHLSHPAHSSHASSVTLPMLPLALPSNRCSSSHQELMRNPYIILAALLPFPPAFLTLLEHPSHSHLQDAAHAAILASTAHHTLAAHLHTASGGGLMVLMGHAGHVKEPWQDMVMLGLYDVPLWDALDLGWEHVVKQPEILCLKVYEPILVVGEDIHGRVNAGGPTFQVYVILQAIVKALVAYHAKYIDTAHTMNLMKTLFN